MNLNRRRKCAGLLMVVKSVNIRACRVCAASKAFPQSYYSFPETSDTGVFSCDFLVLLNLACIEWGSRGEWP